MQHPIHRFLALSVCATLCGGTSLAQTTVFVGTSVGGSSDPWFVVDADNNQLVSEGSSATTDNVSEAFFHPSTAQLVLGSGLGQEIVSAPLVGLSPDFQDLAFQTPAPGGNLNSCVYDARFKRIFTLTRDTSGGGVAHILDGDPLSPTYGVIMHSVALPKGALSLGLSEDSTLLTTPAVGFEEPVDSMEGSLPIIDVDPASPGFLTVFETVDTPIPAQTLGVDSFISPDNRFVSVVLFSFGPGSLVAKYDRQTQSWIDADPTQPGTQHFLLPVSFLASTMPIPGTESAFVASGFGKLGRLDMPGANPVDWSFTLLQDYASNLTAAKLSANGTRFAIGLVGPPRLVIANAGDGAIISELPLSPIASSISTVAWSDPGVGAITYCNPAPANSTGASAQLIASGSSVASQNDVVMTATNLPPLGFGFLITSLSQGFVQNPGGSQGHLCLGGVIGRYVGPGQIQQSSLAGEWAVRIDLTQQPQPNGFVPAVAGDSWSYQAWFRDSVGGQATSNLTHGLTINFR